MRWITCRPGLIDALDAQVKWWEARETKEGPDFLTTDLIAKEDLEKFRNNQSAAYSELQKIIEQHNQLRMKLLERQRDDTVYEPGLMYDIFGAFSTGDAEKYLNEQANNELKILTEKIRQIREESPHVGKEARELQVVEQDFRINILIDDYDIDMDKMAKDIHKQVSETLGYIDTVIDDFGGAFWEKYWTLPKQSEEKIEDLLADKKVRIEELNKDVTLSVRRREQKIAVYRTRIRKETC